MIRKTENMSIVYPSHKKLLHHPDAMPKNSLRPLEIVLRGIPFPEFLKTPI
jgi:hypothetical protein